MRLIFIMAVLEKLMNHISSSNAGLEQDIFWPGPISFDGVTGKWGGSQIAGIMEYTSYCVTGCVEGPGKDPCTVPWQDRVAVFTTLAGDKGGWEDCWHGATLAGHAGPRQH